MIACTSVTKVTKWHPGRSRLRLNCRQSSTATKLHRKWPKTQNISSELYSVSCTALLQMQCPMPTSLLQQRTQFHVKLSTYRSSTCFPSLFTLVEASFAHRQVLATVCLRSSVRACVQMPRTRLVVGWGPGLGGGSKGWGAMLRGVEREIGTKQRWGGAGSGLGETKPRANLPSNGTGPGYRQTALLSITFFYVRLLDTGGSTSWGSVMARFAKFDQYHLDAHKTNSKILIASVKPYNIL